MKKLFFFISLFTISISFGQTPIVVIESAPISLEQGEAFAMEGSFDAISPGSVDGNLAFVLRLYNTITNNYVSQIVFGSVNKNGIIAESNVTSNSMTVPALLTPTADLSADREYRLVVSYLRTTAQDYVSTTQVVTITEGPRISYTSLPVEISSVAGIGYGYGVLPYEITWSNVTPGVKLFNQLKDANGDQVAGFAYDVTTANGSQIITWNFFGAGTLVALTNAGVFSQYAGVSSISNTTIPIVGTTLSNKPYEINKVGVYPNPTTENITIETEKVFNSVKVFDITGKEVKSFKNQKIFNVSELVIGIYFLKTDTGLLAKFIKD